MNRALMVLTLILLMFARALPQAGGGFNLEQNVIGNGGWRSDGGGFTVLGTMGQSSSGSTAAGGLFHIIDGLWAIENQTAGSALVSISGQVARPVGPGIPRVLVTLTNKTTNQSFETFTEAHGSYRFSNIPSGASYRITVSHNHFTFDPNSLVVFISQDREHVDFVSLQ